jgi:hypothetical protein
MPTLRRQHLKAQVNHKGRELIALPPMDVAKSGVGYLLTSRNWTRGGIEPNHAHSCVFDVPRNQFCLRRYMPEGW